MKQAIMYIFARTPLHIGAGSSVGAIDLPVQRERHTGFPIIPGSSIKGVLRDHFKALGAEAVNDLFGRGGGEEAMEAGKIAFGEAKLLAFPVRSAKGAFAMATSSLTLQRFARDSGQKIPVPEAPPDMSCLAGDKLVFERNGKKGVVLEEYCFNVSGEFPADWEKALCSLLNDAVLQGAKGRYVLLSEGDLSHFAVNACQVSQHVCIDDNTGTAKKGALFNEETVPSETLFYAPVIELRSTRGNNHVFEKLASEVMVQFGGASTTGLGFCTVKLQTTGEN